MMKTSIAAIAAFSVAVSANPKPQKTHIFKVPQLGCAPGLEMRGKMCTGTEQIPAEINCSKGLELVDGRCVAYSQLLKYCPEGFTKNGKECGKKIDIKQIPTCEDGFTLYNNHCEKTMHVKPVCPNGTIDNGKECSVESPLQHKCNDGFNMVNGKCLKRIPHQLTPLCNEGVYNSHTNQCETEVILDKVCPNGLINQNGVCIETRPYNLVCDDGFTLINGKCILKDIVSLIPTCQDGYYLNEQTNTCEKIIQLDPICPNGYSIMEYGKEKCANKTPALTKCPEGYQSRNGKEGMICEQITNVDLVPICKSDEQLIDNKYCEKIIYREPICPKHSTICPKTGHCLIFDKPIRRCNNSAFRLVENQCFFDDYAEALPICQDGYQLMNDECIKIVEERPVCPRNYKEYGDKCIKESMLKSRCPENTNRIGDRCVEFIATPLEPRCSKGMELCNQRKNTCFAFIPGTIKNVCNDGEELVEDQCMTQEFIKPDLLCPEDYELTNGKCQKEIDYDCSKTTYTEVCEDNKPHHAGIHSHKVPSRTTCTKVPNIVSKTCNKIVYAEAISECPHGTEFLKDICISRQYRPSKQICLDGESVENCVREKTKPAQMVCPVDGSNNRCGFEQYHDLIRYCADGYEMMDNKCVNFAGKICLGGSCVKTMKSPLKHVCPDGYHKNRSGAFRSGKGQMKCKKMIKEDSELYCENDEFILMDGTCVKNIDKIQREPLINKSNPNMICPLDDKLNNGSCSIVDIAQPIQFCRPEYELYDNACLKFKDMICPNNGDCTQRLQRPVNMICPLNGKSNTNCENITEAIPNKVCNQMFELTNDNTKCIRFENKICPVNGCIRTATHAPSMVCPVNNESSKDGCYTVEESSPSNFCNSGFERIGDKCLRFSSKVCPNGQCTNVIRQNPRYTCPVQSSKGCYEYETADLLTRCPSGFENCGKDQCCAFSSPRTFCPAGSRQDKSGCLRDITAKPIQISKK